MTCLSSFKILSESDGIFLPLAKATGSIDLNPCWSCASSNDPTEHALDSPAEEATSSSKRAPTGSGSGAGTGSLYPTSPCPAGHRARAAAPGESRLRAFSRARGVGDGEGDSRSADLRGEEAAETAPDPGGFAFDLDLDLPGHHAGIAPPPPGAKQLPRRWRSPGRVSPPPGSIGRGARGRGRDVRRGERGRGGGRRAARGRREVGAEADGASL